MLGNRDDRDRTDAHDDDGATRVHDDHGRTTGTTTGADVTSRMTGTHDAQHAHGDHTDRDHSDHSPGHADDHTDRDTHRSGVADAPRTERYEHRARILPAKTSVAAAFALVFGLSALFTALTAILAPAAILFGLIGIVLGIAGMKMAKREGVTGKGVAIGGLVTAILGLLLGGAVLAGAAVYVNDEQRLDQLQTWIDDARNDIPTGSDIVETIPGS